MSSANTCKFFLQGNCWHGERCRFYHPRRGQQRGGSSRHQAPPSYDRSDSSWHGKNRFSLFSDWSGNNGDGGGGGNGERGRENHVYDQHGGQQDIYHYTNPNYRSSHHRDQSEDEGWRGGGMGRAGRGRGGGWVGGGRRKGEWNAKEKDERGDRRSDNYHDSYSSSSSSTGSHQDLVTIIRKDMEKWKTSSMWPLSCYGNLHLLPYLPGLVDVSPEEMRFEAYKVNSSETSAQFLQNVEELCSQQAAMISKYSDLTLEDMKQLENLSPVSSGNGSSGLFGSLTKSGLFHSATVAGSTSLANTTTNRSLFGEPQFSLSGTENKQTGTTLFTPSSVLQMNTLAPRNLFSSPASAMVNSSPSSSQKSTLLSATTIGTNPDDDTSELTEEVLKAFKADAFVFKQIPEYLPPPYLC